jgi:hypothetical protein
LDLSLTAVPDAPGGTHPPPALTLPPPPPDPALQLIAAGADWRYLDGDADPGPGWNLAVFDDTAWGVGPAELGFGDGDEATAIVASSGQPAATAYFRHDFEVTAPAVSALALEVIRDDGVAVYLNGVELVRDNLPGGPLGPDTLPTAYVSGGAEATFQAFAVPSTALVAGTNTLAVEVHQAAGSVDLSFDLALRAVP